MESSSDQYGLFRRPHLWRLHAPQHPANLFDFYFPNDPSITSVAPRGASLDNLRKTWSIQEIHEEGEAVMMCLMQSVHRELLKYLWAQLDDGGWLEKIEARHCQEFYERRAGSPLTDLHGAIASRDAS